MTSQDGSIQFKDIMEVRVMKAISVETTAAVGKWVDKIKAEDPSLPRPSVKQICAEIFDDYNALTTEDDPEEKSPTSKAKYTPDAGTTVSAMPRQGWGLATGKNTV